MTFEARLNKNEWWYIMIRVDDELVKQNCTKCPYFNEHYGTWGCNITVVEDDFEFYIVIDDVYEKIQECPITLRLLDEQGLLNPEDYPELKFVDIDESLKEEAQREVLKEE